MRTNSDKSKELRPIVEEMYFRECTRPWGTTRSTCWYFHAISFKLKTLVWIDCSDGEEKKSEVDGVMLDWANKGKKITRGEWERNDAQTRRRDEQTTRTRRPKRTRISSTKARRNETIAQLFAHADGGNQVNSFTLQFGVRLFCAT